MPDGLIDGRFRLLRLLGRGQGGQVWEAIDEQVGGAVAVKLFDGRSGPAPAIRLNHPNIVAVYLAGTHNGVPYMVMELVDGVSLATVLEEGPLHRDDAVPIASSVSLALHAAHAAGVVHGNLKPTNVFVADRGVVKVGDFAGTGEPDADMYSLGLLMEAMSGHRDPVVDRLLSRQPYTAAELYEVLTGQPLPASEPAPARDERDGDAEPQRPKLFRLAVITGVATLALIVAVCVWFLSPTSPPQMNEGQAPSEGAPTSPADPTSSLPAETATPSTAAAPAAGTGVNGVKTVIANQLRAGQIQPAAAAQLNERLDEVARFQSRGQTKQANDRIAGLKSLLAEQRRDGQVTADGYNAILAAVNKLTA